MKMTSNIKWTSNMKMTSKMKTISNMIKTSNKMRLKLCSAQVQFKLESDLVGLRYVNFS